MKYNTKKYLSIVLIDYDNDDTKLFKAISSINNQIGFNLRKDICVDLVTNRMINDDLINNPIFNKLEINVIKVDNKNYYRSLNNVIESHEYEWITFMDSRDLLFADGSLLDFIYHSKSSENNHDIFIFNYISLIEENDKISGFEYNKFTNFIFGKYFNVNFLIQNELLFNEKLNYYLFDDFSSKSMKICNNAIFYDLINYYLSPRKRLKEPAMEFINYRIDFINFIKKHSSESIIDDIIWSIVQAFSLLKEQNLFNNDYKNKMEVLYKFAISYHDYDTLLENQFKIQLGNKEYFDEFIKFLGV